MNVDGKKWTTFIPAKELLYSATVFVHYDPRLTLCMATDASSYGVGAVISHVTLMALSELMRMLPKLWQPVRKSMHRLRKRHSPSFLEFVNSINFCTEEGLSCIPMTSISLPSLAQGKQFFHWRIFFWQHTTTWWSLNPLEPMQMLMVCKDYLCLLHIRMMPPRCRCFQHLAD